MAAKSPTPQLRAGIREIMASAPSRRWTKSAIIRGVKTPAVDPDADPVDIARELAWNVAQTYVGEFEDPETEQTTYALTILGKADQGVA
jgi:hypothetical protein